MMLNDWSEIFKVRTWDVDRADRLTLAAAFNYFQEVAGNHAEAIGIGRNRLMEKNQAWVLSRMSALILRRPAWGEEITVRTWPRGTDRLFALRDYDMVDPSNNVIARGRSAWIVLDLGKMRPLRPQSVMDTIPQNEGRDALKDGITALEKPEGSSKVSSRQAAYSDIDYNGHVNNARYVQWIQDILSPRDLEGALTLRLDINYLTEVREDEPIDLYQGSRNLLAPLEGPRSFSIALEGRHRDTDQSAFRAELRWE
jgi:acyl-ACP thioesterase